MPDLDPEDSEKLTLGRWIADIRGRKDKLLDMYHGYIHVYAPHHWRADNKGRVKEHILVFETVHKCCLLKYGDIHHIDGNKQHNDWINLQGLSHGQHSSLTNKKPIPDRTCLRCNRGTRMVHNMYRRHPHIQWYKYTNGYICRSCYEMLRYYRKNKLDMENFLSKQAKRP